MECVTCMSMGIYLITNIITQQNYVGQTYDLKRRKHQHFLSLKKGTHDNPFLQASFNKYGEENFTFQVLDASAKNQNELNDLEEYYMLQYGYPDRDKCYNLQLPNGVPNRCYEIYEQQEKICNDYQSNMTIREILDKYSMSLSSLYNILRTNNIPIGVKGSRLDLYENSDEIIYYYVEEGLTASKIGELFDTSSTMILKILRQNNINTDEYHNNRHDLWKKADEVCALYQEKQSLKKVADHYNVSQNMVYDILKDNNVFIKNPKRTDIDEKQVCKDYMDGSSSRELAKKYGCAKGTILNILKRNNIPRRVDKSTQFQKGSVPHNKGTSLLEKKGGVEYIRECILKDMTPSEITESIGYKNFSNVSAYLTKHGTSYSELKKELMKLDYKSGYYHVTKEKHGRKKQGWMWRYRYKDKDGKKKSICSVDINKLEEKVKAKGLEWIKL